jgi:hypothetical protein
LVAFGAWVKLMRSNPTSVPPGWSKEAHAVAEQHRRDEHEHLVELARLQALPGDAGPQDVHIFICGGVLSRGRPLPYD